MNHVTEFMNALNKASEVLEAGTPEAKEDGRLHRTGRHLIQVLQNVRWDVSRREKNNG